MAEIINLRRARKARDRTAADVQAAANRQRFGRTKAEKLAEAHEQARTARIVDGARREPSDVD
jgi:hypothetical protein